SRGPLSTRQLPEKERWDFRVSGHAIRLPLSCMLLLALAPNAKKTEKEREQRSWQIDRNNPENAFLQSHSIGQFPVQESSQSRMRRKSATRSHKSSHGRE